MTGRLDTVNVYLNLTSSCKEGKELLVYHPFVVLHIVACATVFSSIFVTSLSLHRNSTAKEISHLMRYSINNFLSALLCFSPPPHTHTPFAPILRRIHELLDTDKDGIISARQALRGLREINDFHLSDMEARFTISILEALSSMPFDSAGVPTVAGLIEDFDVSYCMYPLRHTLSTAPHTCRKRGN